MNDMIFMHNLLLVMDCKIIKIIRNYDSYRPTSGELVDDAILHAYIVCGWRLLDGSHYWSKDYG